MNTTKQTSTPDTLHAVLGELSDLHIRLKTLASVGQIHEAVFAPLAHEVKSLHHDLQHPQED